ncbi:MAG: hypothetical protein ACXACY_25160 [Candidatus Hodarchaeales archaeon]
MQDRDYTSESLDQLDKALSEAKRLLENRRFALSEDKLILSEIYYNDLEIYLKSKMGDPLNNEIKLQLEFLSAQLNAVLDELQLDSTIIDQIMALKEQMNSNLSQLDKNDFSGIDIIRAMDSIENSKSTISGIITVLKLQNNVEENRKKLLFDLGLYNLILDIADKLGIDIAYFINLQNNIISSFDRLSGQRIRPIEDLLNQYKDFTNLLNDLRKEMIKLQTKIKKKWNLLIPPKGEYIIMVPKFCFKNISSSGYISLGNIDLSSGPLSINLNGILISYGTHVSLEIEGKRSMTTFDFVGEKDGVGIVKLNSKSLFPNQNFERFPIRILPSNADIAKSSFLYGTSIGGIISFCVFMYLGFNIALFSVISAGIGGACGSILFLIRYLRLSKYRSSIN